MKKGDLTAEYQLQKKVTHKYFQHQEMVKYRET